MAGILDSKERLIDFIITPQGRGQMADGRMRIEFATLTDMHTFYTSSRPDGIADDASGRIYFETHTSRTDLITPEIAPGNFMQPFRAGSFVIAGKNIAKETFQTSSTGFTSDALTGSQIQDDAESMLSSLFKHFEGMRILGSEDVFSNSSEFDLGASTGSFIITDKDLEMNQGRGIYLKDLSPNYFPEDERDTDVDGSVSLEKSPSIYADPRFAHFPNFRYMPPVNVPEHNKEPQVLGNYPKLNSANETENPIAHLSTRQKVTVNIAEVSKYKNLFCQAFQFSNLQDASIIDKLSIVDYGVFPGPIGGSPRHYFFVGKLYRDAEGVDTFMNIFTLEFFDPTKKIQPMGFKPIAQTMFKSTTPAMSVMAASPQNLIEKLAAAGALEALATSEESSSVPSLASNIFNL